MYLSCKISYNVRIISGLTFLSFLGVTYPLEAALKNGGGRDHPTVATLSVKPGKDDDGAIFRCSVWNRAMPENAKLETTVTLNVNCKYYF